MNEIKTILVTGNAGLLGGSLVKWILLNTPHNVVGIDDMSGGLESNIPPDNRFGDRFVQYKMDQIDIKLEDVFKLHKPNIVYLMACYASEGASPFIRKFNYMNNVVSAMNVINCCIKFGCDRLVFTSSMAVYGHGKPPFHEDDMLQPCDSYGIGKLSVELDLKAAGKQHGLNWTIIRPHNVYAGELADPNILNDYSVGQNIYDPYRNVLAIWMWNIKNNRPITIYGKDGLQTRAFSHMKDIVVPLWNASIRTETLHQIINLGGIIPYSIVDAAHILGDITGYKDIIFLPKREEVFHAFSTWDKSINLLDFKHNTSLEIGIKTMWKWAQQMPNNIERKILKYEIDKGLYPYWKPEILINGYSTI